MESLFIKAIKILFLVTDFSAEKVKFGHQIWLSTSQTSRWEKSIEVCQLLDLLEIFWFGGFIWFVWFFLLLLDGTLVKINCSVFAGDPQKDFQRPLWVPRWEPLFKGIQWNWWKVMQSTNRCLEMLLLVEEIWNIRTHSKVPQSWGGKQKRKQKEYKQKN